MNDVFDYLFWRGDLTFDERPFNEIDNVIMARLSYFPLDKVVTNDITICNAYLKSIKCGLKDTDYLNEKDPLIFKTIASLPRYKDLVLSDFINQIDYDKEQQFGAVTIILPNNIKYISYRGTDNTLIGFKEDFNMAFMDELPSQKLSVIYINKLINDNSLLYVGGHSKGGNLAIYASIKCERSIQDRILTIFNNDGPGFLNSFENDISYKHIKNKICTLIPGSSIVGKLLNNTNNYKIVKSDNKFILQHDLYFWKVNKDSFTYLDKLNDDSKEVESIIRDWLKNLSYDDRKKFVDTLYNILVATNAKTVDDLDDNVLSKIKIALQAYKGMDEKDKEPFNKAIKYFVSSLKQNIFKNNNK